MEMGDCYLIFQGGTGTISEFGMAWGLARLYFGHHKPLVLYGKEWHTLLACLSQTMLLRVEEKEVYRVANSPEGALAAIQKFEQALVSGSHKHLFSKGEGAFQI